MKRLLFLLYGITSYFVFLGIILYAIGFIGNLFVSTSIDGEPKTFLATAVIVDASLLLLVALQHSIMARPAFKQWWTKYVPEPLERSTFVLLTSSCLLLLLWQWQPIGGVVWSIENETVKAVLFIIYLIGWVIVVISTFLINHFDLFGLRQAWFYFGGRQYRQPALHLPLLYGYVKRPLYLGFLIAFWSAPVMTVTHLLFALLVTGYIVTAIQFEEKDRVPTFGKRSSDYKKWSPMVIPFNKKRAARKEVRGRVF